MFCCFCYTNNVEKKFFIAIVLTTIILITGFVFWQQDGSQSGKYDSFAKCLKEKGAIFYGAFWCPHCQKQKSMFKGSEQYLPYVECSTADGKGQTKECINKNIQSYPTWEFKGGQRKSGEIPLEELAKQTNCPLPK